MISNKVSVIISTYNKPLWLEKVLWSYECQTFKNFEVIIADDGSDKPTKDLITKMIELVSFKIHHVWQKDDGFQKTKILNKAIIKASSDYLIFTDGDCIARKDFVENHLKLKKENHFLSGGYFKLTETVSNLISKETIYIQDCFNKKWLLQNGISKSFKMNKLNSKGFKRWLLNNFTPTKATFDGMNVSGWKKDILAVNGFDERMQYGGEDRELGERLMNYGITFKQVRYSAICLHLYHERSYVKPEMFKKNKEIRKQTRLNKSVYTNYGIIKSD